MILRKLLEYVSNYIKLAPLHIITILLMSAICSCSRTQYVPVPSVSTDSVFVYKHIRDSIVQRDSVFVKEKGDTIYVNKYKYIYKNKLIRDTMYIAQIDSVRVPYPVERKLSKWQSMKLELGGIAMGALIVSIGLIIVKFILRRFGKR